MKRALLTGSALLCASAAAQPASAQVPATAPAPAPATTPAPPATAAQASPSPAPAPASVPAPPAAAPPAWYAKLKLGAFVDTYASINENFPKAQTGENLFRAYDVSNGFAIHWAGLDASFDADPVGGTINLRFGPGASIFNQTDGAIGLVNVKQAYATWKPLSSLTFDLGKFESFVGSEVADSQANINYTRSALYWLAQPLFFTGLRLDWAPVDVLDVKLMIANGWNNSVDTNTGKTGGAQVTLKPSDKVALALGYVFGPEQADTIINPMTKVVSAVPGADQRFRHFVDFTADVNPTPKLRLLLDGSLGVEQIVVNQATQATQQVKWYGANLAVRYAATERFSVALRGEVYRDPNGFTTSTYTGNVAKDLTLVDGTLTLGFNPTENLLLKLDQRVDHAQTPDGAQLFVTGTGASSVQVTTTLGVVATTN